MYLAEWGCIVHLEGMLCSVLVVIVTLVFQTEDGLQATATYENELLILDFGKVVISYILI